MQQDDEKSDYLKYLEESYLAENDELKAILADFMSDLSARNNNAIKELMVSNEGKIDELREKTKSSVENLAHVVQSSARLLDENSEYYKRQIAEIDDKFEKLRNSVRLVSLGVGLGLGVLLAFVSFILFA